MNIIYNQATVTTKVKIFVLDIGTTLIREYKASDRNACIEIFNSNLPLYFAPEELPLLEKWLNAKDKNENAYVNNLAEHFYVVEHNSKVIACGGFYIPSDTKIANVTWGMVKNEFHNKGIGKKFLLYRIEEIKGLYPEYSIVLDTSQHTYQFFTKEGFVVTKITKDGYGKELDRYDMILK